MSKLDSPFKIMFSKSFYSVFFVNQHKKLCTLIRQLKSPIVYWL
jgi:hypothetical protein